MGGPAEWKNWQGTIDGKFPLRQWLGGSDHSAVFLTERPGQSQKFAIKLIVDDTRADRQLARWKAAAQLSHPHLIHVYEAGRCRRETTALLYLVMDYAEEDLGQILPQRALTPGEVTDMLPPLLDALAYLHGRGLAHGRVKPSNIQATGEQLKLSADSIASFGEPSPENRVRDIYDAPETGEGVISATGDIWSVGVTLMAALTQNVSLDVNGPRDPEPPATIPPPFRGIARECLHLDPKRRCSLDDIQARLQPAGKSVPAAAEPPASPQRQARKLRGRVIALLLFALALFMIFALHRKKKSPTAQAIQMSEPASQIPAEPAANSRSTEAAPPQSAPQSNPPPTKPKPIPSSNGDVVHKVLPEASRSAQNTITGTVKVTVRVDVDSAGKVSAAKLTSAGPSQYFAGLALKAAREWEFSPPAVDGASTPSLWAIEFRYKRNSIQASAERSKR